MFLPATADIGGIRYSWFHLFYLLKRKPVIYILRIEYKEDLEKIGNPDVRQYIEEQLEYICEAYGFEWEFDAFSNYGIGELILIEKQNEIPL